MALPTILVNSATGSDSAASGAGPGTALTGTAATTSADGLTVTLDGSPDLSGVATDGSAVIFLNDSTAGARNFGKITGVDNGAKTVTVSNAFRLSIGAGDSIDWAIGGKRASIGSTTSKKLADNNGAAGDAMPGWIVEMESGHSETIAATFATRRDGDATDGRITLRGTAGAGTLPLLTFSNNGDAISIVGDYWLYKDFELRNSNATKTASIALHLATSNCTGTVINGVKVSHATDKFWKGFRASATGATGVRLSNVEIGHVANFGMEFRVVVGAGGDNLVENCWVHHCGSHGIEVVFGSGNTGPLSVIGTIISNNTGDGIHSVYIVRVNYCTIHDNDGDGIELTATSFAGLSDISNNNITSNGGWGINFSGASMNDTKLNQVGFTIRNNLHNGNTSGWISASITVDTDTVSADPAYVDAVNGNFEIGTAGKAKGYPLAGSLKVGKYSDTDSFVDIGAAQREEPVGGSGGSTGDGGRFNGGFN